MGASTWAGSSAGKNHNGSNGGHVRGGGGGGFHPPGGEEGLGMELVIHHGCVREPPERSPKCRAWRASRL